MSGIVYTTPSLGIRSTTNTNLYKDILRYLDIPEPLIVCIVAVFVLLLFVLFILFCSRCCFKKCRGNIADKDKYKIHQLDTKEIENILNDKISGGQNKRFGKISFSMKFNYDKEVLIIKIIEVGELPKPLDGSLDPYVVIRFPSNDKIDEQKTRIKMKTEKPVFNQKFTFKMSMEEFVEAKVLFMVFDYDKLGEDSLMGKYTINIGDVDWNEMINMDMEFTKELEQGEDISMGRGQICVVLNNLGDTGLSVTILEAKDVRVKDHSNYSHLFVTVKLKSGIKFQTRKTIMKKITKECPCTKFPYFNESFIFPKPDGSIANCQITVKIWMGGFFKMATCIGVVCLQSNIQRDSGGQHWEAMLDNPRHPIAKWHTFIDPNEIKSDSTM